MIKEPIQVAPASGVVPMSDNVSKNETELVDVFRVLFGYKWWILAITFFFAAVSALYALSLPNMYASSTLLAPVSDGQSVPRGLVGGLGGLADLAGISLGGASVDKTQLAIATLKSRQFVLEFVEKNNFIPPLMAAKKWDSETGILILNENRYSSEDDAWLRDGKKTGDAAPTAEAIYNRFIANLIVSENKHTGLITIRYESISPVFSEKVVSSLVDEVNYSLQKKKIDQSERNINYLKEQISQTNVLEMQKIFYSLLEEQTKNIMLARGRDDFVFEYVDPPAVPEKKSRPQRFLLVIVGLLVGCVFSVFLAIVFNFFISEKEQFGS